MTKAIRIHHFGDADQLSWEEVDIGDPGPGQARIRNRAVGLNFIDIYHRTGLYPLDLPCTLGMEGAGEVLAVGEGVGEVSVGDRVAYAQPPGAYAEERLIPADRLMVLPPSIDFETAAAMMLQGLTAHYLLRRTFPVKAGDKILIHAAAGGVGLLVCQWAKHLGATVIGTAGSEAKADLARRHGCDHPILYRHEDFTKAVLDLTDDKGVDVVYDSIGRDTFEQSLDCLRPLGMMVSFGNASGPVPPFDPSILAQKGSLFLTRPTLMSYVATRPDLLAAASELFDVVADGHVKISVNQTYPLAEAAQAHRDLEARKTTGATVLLP